MFVGLFDVVASAQTLKDSRDEKDRRDKEMTQMENRGWKEGA